MAIFFTTTPTRTRGASHASIITRNSFVSLDDLDELPPSVTVSNLNVPTPPLTIRIPPLTTATHSGQPPTVKVFIPLKTLFKYPTDKDPPSEGMNTFWKGGVQNLEKEMEAYELLNGLSEDSTTGEINPKITMQVCM